MQTRVHSIVENVQQIQEICSPLEALLELLLANRLTRISRRVFPSEAPRHIAQAIPHNSVRHHMSLLRSQQLRRIRSRNSDLPREELEDRSI
jgi:hypothetical protein